MSLVKGGDAGGSKLVARGDPVFVRNTNLSRVFRVASKRVFPKSFSTTLILSTLITAEDKYASNIRFTVLFTGRCTNTELTDGRDTSTRKEAQEISTSEALTI